MDVPSHAPTLPALLLSSRWCAILAPFWQEKITPFQNSLKKISHLKSLDLSHNALVILEVKNFGWLVGSFVRCLECS